MRENVMLLCGMFGKKRKKDEEGGERPCPQ